MHSGCVSDEGGEDHVDALLHPEQKVHFVLLGNGRKVGVGARKVAAFPGAEVAAVLDLADDEVVT